MEAGVDPRPAMLEADETLSRLYLSFLLSTFAIRLDGVHLVIDCGNGAAYRLAPELFRNLGAAVEVICCEPDGRNINLNCGALHLDTLQKTVMARGADLGVSGFHGAPGTAKDIEFPCGIEIGVIKIVG